ncbi:MAG: hypothetical protein IPN95_00140 [Bacteroidetes bacterium]|nr:hypothetical protein [Bacteroidota bacterium]
MTRQFLTTFLLLLALSLSLRIINLSMQENFIFSVLPAITASGLILLASLEMTVPFG